MALRSFLRRQHTGSSFCRAWPGLIGVRLRALHRDLGSWIPGVLRPDGPGGGAQAGSGAEAAASGLSRQWPRVQAKPLNNATAIHQGLGVDGRLVEGEQLAIAQQHLALHHQRAHIAGLGGVHEG